MDIRECDALEGVRSLPNRSVHFVLIDPPYGISSNRENNNFKAEHGGGGDQYRFGKLDLVMGDWDTEFDWHIFDELYRVLRTHGNIICFYDIWKMGKLRTYLEKIGFLQFRLCEWIKTNPVPVNSKHNYLSNAKEYFLYAVKSGKATFHSEYDDGVYRGSLCHGKERTNHPTQKPLYLFRQLIEKHTNLGDVVLDCFMGAGTTAVACKQTGREFIGFEQDKRYIDLAKTRLDDTISKS